MDNISGPIIEKSFHQKLFIKTIPSPTKLKPPQPSVSSRSPHSSSNSSFSKSNSLNPCRKTDPNVTWSLNYPTGWWEGGKWRTSLCRQEGMSRSRLSRCLTDLNVWMFGDSNSVRMAESFFSLFPEKSFKCNSQGRRGLKVSIFFLLVNTCFFFRSNAET